MRLIFYIITICFLMLTGCASTLYEKNNIPDSIGGTPHTIVLNYENRVKDYEKSNIDSHLKIYIEIEEPYVISIPGLKKMDKIYSIAAIEGTAVFRVEISDEGTILSTEKILSAGLGLDELAEDIISQIKVEPSYLAGKPEKSAADIKIIFRADETE